MKFFTTMALLACSIGLPAMPAARAATHVSSHTSTHHRTSLQVDDHALDWRSDGNSLRLHDGPSGMKVISLVPDGWLGLHRGDLILAVDGRTVTTIASLQRALRELDTRAAVLTVRAPDGGHRDVMLAGDDYARWLTDVPEPPPPPPRVTTAR